MLGEHTNEVLTELLGMSEDDINHLKSKGTIHI